MLTYTQVDELLTLYPIIRTRIQMILCEFQTVAPWQHDFTPDEVAAGLALASKWPDGMPHPPEGNTSDKTATVAVMYQKVYEDEQVSIDKDRVDELLGLYEVINKIEVALRSLPKPQQDVIRMRYFEGKTWDKIADTLQYTVRWCHEQRRKAISELQGILLMSEQNWAAINRVKEAIKI